MRMKHAATFATLACLLSLGACGGGSSKRPPQQPPLPQPPATESVSAVGVITALNSATINGVVYDTDSTMVMRNGQAASFSDLEIGQIVALGGTIEVIAPRGTADQIDYEATVIGPIENIDAALGRLVVMGQLIRTDADTAFDPSIDPLTFAGLTVGANVDISGFRTADDEVIATRIEPDTVTVGVQTIGSVTGLDLANLLFRIGGLTVDYSSASVIDLPGGMPTDGQFVLVRGALAGGILTADSLEALYDASPGTPGDRAQAQGVITRFASATDFDVNGFPMTTDSSTAYSGGAAADLQLDAEITVDGEVAASGDVILANLIAFGQVVGETTTLTFNLSNFNEINVSTVFNVTVTQAAGFLVEVTIDEEDANRVDVTQSGTVLNIGLRPATGNVEIQTIEAVVTLPILARIDLDGVINATLNDFSQPQLQASVRGVSRLFSDSMSIGSLSAEVLNVSQLDLGNARPLTTAALDVRGVSTATVNMNVGSSLTGTVVGVSSLNYYGTNVAVNVTVGTGSALNRLGDTRP